MKKVYNRAKRASFSQNYIKNKALIRYIINLSEITPDDTVVEIGPGEGYITEQLVPKAAHIYAIEKDKENFESLKKKFSNETKVQFILGDALKHRIPFSAYKIFSNPPFSITSDLVKKYLFTKPHPKDVYLILQKEAANRLTGFKKSSPISITINNMYKTKLLHRFKKTDFSPAPNIDTQLIQFKRKGLENSITENPKKFEEFLNVFFINKETNIKNSLKRKFRESEIKQMAEEVSFNPGAHLSTLTWSQWREIYERYLKN